MLSMIVYKKTSARQRFDQVRSDFLLSIYLFKVNNRNTIAMCEICSNLRIKTPERRQWRRSGVFIVNFEHITFLPCSSVSIINFEQVNTGWVEKLV